MHACTYTYQTHTHTHTHTHSAVMNAYIHTCMHTCTYTYKTHTHTHTHTHIHTHTHTEPARNGKPHAFRLASPDALVVVLGAADARTA